MAETPDGVTLVRHTVDDVPALLDELCDAYTDAYGVVPGEDIGVKTAAFRDRATKALGAPNYSLVTARSGGQLVGFAFGYGLRPERGWWDGLEPEPPEGFTEETGSRTAVLSEIEVRRAWQGRGVGRAVHDAFLAGRSEERATLSTGPNADAARALYERWGWRQVGKMPGAPGAYFPYYIKYVLPLPLGGRR
jgi:ribosomal protein S18 acetylase RimI-like enzyme